MVETRLALELEVQEIFKHIDSNQYFLLSGGAGSGKTYSLVQVIQQLIKENPTSKIACMTYTNAAVKEIEERVKHQNLSVTTIHDFLWDNIKHFQKELKAALITLANNEEITKISIDGFDVIPNHFFDLYKIQYTDYLKLREGKISHDELLIIANYLFEKYPRLCDIVKDKYKFILIDEYQDTDKLVIKIFLEYFTKSKKQNTIGFFGDSMQSIYDEGIGNLDGYKENVQEVKKEQNRRNPQKIIDLANKLRTDGIIQEPSRDLQAPNIFNGEIKKGNILFLHSLNSDISIIKDYLKENYKWNFDNSKETKELNLTHNLIAEKAGFRQLMDIYDKDPVIGLKKSILEKIKKDKKNNKPEIEIQQNDTFEDVIDKFKLANSNKILKKDILLQDSNDTILYNFLKDKPFSEVRKIYLSKDALIDDKKQDEKGEDKKGSKRDDLIRHLFKIQRNIALYLDGQFNEFLRITDYKNKLTKVEDKRLLKRNIENLIHVGNKTIEEIIIEADEKGICLIDDKLRNFRIKNNYLYNRVKEVKFKEFQNLFYYLENKTPFSTQHKTKGREYDSVLVILDNGNWNDYNFEYLFNEEGKLKEFIEGKSKTKGKLDSFPKILNRTQKIFYVCCTRAKENLAVFYNNPSQQVIDKAKEWFGDENVISI